MADGAAQNRTLPQLLPDSFQEPRGAHRLQGRQKLKLSAVPQKPPSHCMVTIPMMMVQEEQL